MFRQACSLFTYRRKSTVLIVALIALAAFLMMSVGPLFGAIVDTTMEKFFTVSGKHHAVFFDLSDEQLQQLRDAAAVQEMGIIINYGNYPVQDGQYQLTFGNFDETAMTLGNLRAAEGRFPETADEVMLEEHLRYILGDGSLEIGDTLQVQVDDQSRILTICGFLADYSGQWNVMDDKFPGINDYPKLLVTADALPGVKARQSAMLYLKAANKANAPNSTVLRLATDIGLEYNLVFNDTTYWINHTYMITPVQGYQGMFTLLVLLGAGVLLYVALFTYFGTYDEAAATLYSLGASIQTVCIQLLLWSVLPALCGVLGGIGLSMIFAAVVNPLVGITLRPLAQWPMAVITFAGVLACAAFYFIYKIRPLYGRSYSQRTLQIRRNRRRKAPKDEIDLGKGTAAPMAAHQIQKNLPRMLCVCLLVAMFVMVMIFVGLERNRRSSEWQTESGREPILSVSATSGWRSFLFGTVSGDKEFELAHKLDKYPVSAIEEFYDMAGVKQVVATHTAYPASLIFPEGWSGYANNVIAKYSSGFYQGDADDILSIPDNIKATRHGYGIFVVDERNAEAFAAAYPEIDMKTDLALGKAVLLCPTLKTAYDATNAGITMTSPTGQTNEPMGVSSVSNDAFEPGDPVRFGWLETNIDLNSAATNPVLIKYKEEQFTVSKALDRGLFTDEELRIYGNDRNITVVVSVETAEQTTFLQGIDHVTLYLEEGLTREQYLEIERAFSRVSMRYSGSMPNSFVTEQDTFRRLREGTEVIYVVIGVVLGLFIGFAVFSIVYSTLLQQMRMFGILRAAGYRRGHLFRTVWLELLLYWIITIGMSLSIGLFFLAKFMDIYLLEQMTGANLWYVIGQVGVYAGILLALFTLIAWLITRSVFKKSISSCIRFAE